MGLADHINEQRSAREVTICLVQPIEPRAAVPAKPAVKAQPAAEGKPAVKAQPAVAAQPAIKGRRGVYWRVRIKPLSPAEFVLSGGELNNVFSEGEVLKALNEAKENAKDREAGQARLMAGLAELEAKTLARRLTEPPEVVRHHKTKVRAQSVAVVCAAVEAIDTQDGDGKGWEAVELVAEQRQAKGGAQLWVGDLPARFVGAVFPHIHRISTDGSAEVAAVMARFRGEPDGADGESDQ